MLRVPSSDRRKEIVQGFMEDLKSFTVVTKSTGELHPINCCVCDGIPTEAQWSCMIPVNKLRDLCEASNMQRSQLRTIYPDTLLEQYKAPGCKRLEPFVLSPATYIDKDEDTVLICKACKLELTTMKKKKIKKERRCPPLPSIMNGYLLGQAPIDLTSLNEVELSLVSRVRIYCRSWVFFAGCHRQIQGWHTFYKNRHSANVANLELLKVSGLKGLILVVMCGPFTTTQKALTRKKMAVDPNKVVAAYRWLKDNNIHYVNDEMPHIDDIPIPQIIEEDL
jgi:hypothetical protein